MIVGSIMIARMIEAESTQYPVPPNSALLRTSYMATHTTDHLDHALKALETVGHNLDLIPEDATLAPQAAGA